MYYELASDPQTVQESGKRLMFAIMKMIIILRMKKTHVELYGLYFSWPLYHHFLFIAI